MRGGSFALKAVPPPFHDGVQALFQAVNQDALRELVGDQRFLQSSGAMGGVRIFIIWYP